MVETARDSRARLLILGREKTSSAYRARNGFLKARDKAPKTALYAIADWQRLSLLVLKAAKARSSEAFGAAPETFGTIRNAWWRTQSRANPSPLSNSLLTGKTIGNFAKLPLRERQRL